MRGQPLASPRKSWNLFNRLGSPTPSAFGSMGTFLTTPATVSSSPKADGRRHRDEQKSTNLHSRFRA
jgi:hypothetical protein